MTGIDDGMTHFASDNKGEADALFCIENACQQLLDPDFSLTDNVNIFLHNILGAVGGSTAFVDYWPTNPFESLSERSWVEPGYSRKSTEWDYVYHYWKT